MIAFVIKNKEGKYYKRYFDSGYVGFADNLCFAELYIKKEGADDTKDFILRNKYRFNIENLEVVEITIAEGYLEKELAEKDKELEIYKNLERYDIGELLSENIKLRAKNNTIRKQVCDEIRIALASIEPNCSVEDMNSDLYEFTGKFIYAILDQIEQAKEEQ